MNKGDYIDFKSDVEVLASTLFDIPFKQATASKDVLEAQEKISNIKSKMQSVEDSMLLNINDKVDEKGKPLYSNQAIRDAKVRTMLSDNSEYGVLKNDLEEWYLKLGNAKTRSEYFGTIFSAVKNEVYHRRTIEILDSKKQLNESDVKRFNSEV